MAYVPRNTESACPWCGTNFDSPPQRRRKCKSCKRCCTPKSDPTTYRKRLVGDDEAKELQQAWDEHQARLEAVRLREGRAKMAEYHERYISSALSHPDAAGLILACSEVGKRQGCLLKEHYLPRERAHEVIDGVCNLQPWCYGFMTTAWSDEVAPPPRKSFWRRALAKLIK